MIAGLAYRDAFQKAVGGLVFMAVVFLVGMGIGYRMGTHTPPAPAEDLATCKAAVDATIQAAAERCYDRLDALVTRYQAHLDADMSDLERAARSEGSDDR